MYSPIHNQHQHTCLIMTRKAEGPTWRPLWQHNIDNIDTYYLIIWVRMSFILMVLQVILASDWSRQITWPEYWLVIGFQWTPPPTPRGLPMWSSASEQRARYEYWPLIGQDIVTWPEYWSLIGPSSLTLSLQPLSVPGRVLVGEGFLTMTVREFTQSIRVILASHWSK